MLCVKVLHDFLGLNGDIYGRSCGRDEKKKKEDEFLVPQIQRLVPTFVSLDLLESIWVKA